jgi:hypothetical protein
MLTNERILSVSQAASHFPYRPSLSSIWRWMTRGVKGTKLESIKIGGIRYTSLEAIKRFLAACNTDIGVRESVDSVDAALSADGI